MKIDVSKRKEGALLTVSGRLDAMTSMDFNQACENLLDEGCENIVVDLGALDYISSAGLRSLLVAGKRISADGGNLLLSRLTGMAREVFDISGFSSVFSVYDTVEAAFETLG
ncbi:MAG: anti-sigma factor antagonist [Spartobacteria bacterium]|nr:anti-sigma factor antagonist [Spartobacteria bacterium]